MQDFELILMYMAVVLQKCSKTLSTIFLKSHPFLMHWSIDAVPQKAAVHQEQVVRDKQGRVRFHGAFTGGFSAGYFNTVGSKEGKTMSLEVIHTKDLTSDMAIHLYLENCI